MSPRSDWLETLVCFHISMETEKSFFYFFQNMAQYNIISFNVSYRITLAPNSAYRKLSIGILRERALASIRLFVGGRGGGVALLLLPLPNESDTQVYRMVSYSTVSTVGTNTYLRILLCTARAFHQPFMFPSLHCASKTLTDKAFQFLN